MLLKLVFQIAHDDNQRLEILEFARKKDIKVDELVEITISFRKTSQQRRIDEVLERLGGFGCARRH